MNDCKSYKPALYIFNYIIVFFSIIFQDNSGLEMLFNAIKKVKGLGD